MFKKSLLTLVCFLVVLGFGITNSYGKAATAGKKTEVAAADANSTKTCPIKALFGKKGEHEKKACPKDCKKACCAKKAVDPNAQAVKKCEYDKKTCKKSCKKGWFQKKCPADCKKACCVKNACHANKVADPNAPAVKKGEADKKAGCQKKSDGKKACHTKKPADPNAPAVK